MAENPTTGSTPQNLDELLRQSPFGALLDIQKADGSKLNGGDIFGGLGAPGGGNSFGGSVNIDPNSPYGGNPFAGDNFWNTFAGGVNPSNTSSTNASAGGFSAPGGTSSAPGGSSTASAGFSASGGTPVDPFAGDGSGFWDAFAGGVNPTTFSSSSVLYYYWW